ncbi:exocyst complex component EXO70B1-like [Abrus precatorius]|uniref:Exocyst subunit Exo70 family protein n=1 Tax=Abrus precatorius TaxID=3816 RepID=A0A8B8JPM2_ABRPR|nr:exocyst complex component EXO70B1-like [Abrus precatorius]
MLNLIQSLRWLMQPKLWRFVCFVSSVVGLICYPLSSSFHHLFGYWRWWKILLYTVFCSIISFAVLFAKTRERSSTLRVKAHLAFLVLIITSVYSFFFDKLFKGKTDAYGLVSCTAFAIMSLGLSRQTHFGFEVDLLYFFCGAVIVQLMKIKLWLVTVGASFSYSLIIVRSSLDVPLGRSEHLELQGAQDQVVIEVDLPIQVNTSTENDDLGFLVTQADNSQEGNRDKDSIMARLMSCIEALEKENENLINMLSELVNQYIKGNRISVLQLLPDYDVMMHTMPLGIINDLHETVKLMVESGFEEECCHVYSSCRRKFVEECLSTMGLEALNMMDVENWITACKVTLRTLFPNEKRLCHRVFMGFSSAADISFKEVCEELTISLLSFGDAFATGIHSSNLLCHVIPRVFKTLSNQILEYELLFSDQCSVSLRNEALKAWKRLSEANEGIFVMLESIICGDTVKAIVHGGGVHTVTCQVMNCLREICEARDINRRIEYITTPNRKENSSVISIKFNWIIELLESNLEATSKNYTDIALGYVFMMNNLRYIEAEAKKWKARNILGKHWFRKHATKVRQNFELYQITSWNTVLEFLKQDKDESVAPSIVAESMKEKISLFNMHFEEICNVQSTWSVFGRQLREHIRISLENVLLPVYGNFIDKFQDAYGKRAYDYIEYGISDIQDQLNRLFLVIHPTVRSL